MILRGFITLNWNYVDQPDYVRNNPTGVIFTIYSPLVTSHKFRQEEEEEEVLFQECKQRYVQIYTRLLGA